MVVNPALSLSFLRILRSEERYNLYKKISHDILQFVAHTKRASVKECGRIRIFSLVVSRRLVLIVQMRCLYALLRPS